MVFSLLNYKDDARSHKHKIHKFVFVYDEVFFRVFDVRNGMFKVVVQYIGPPDRTSNTNTQLGSLMKIIRKVLQ